jgi:hypothetical protein
MIKEIGIMTAAAALSIGGLMGISMADTADTDKTTPATEWHNLVNNNPGHDGVTGTPTAGPGNSNGIHDVGPGEAANAKTTDPGDPPACTFHGGFQNGGDDKKVCVD